MGMRVLRGRVDYTLIFWNHAVALDRMTRYNRKKQKK
jgi:hypothetical protein